MLVKSRYTLNIYATFGVPVTDLALKSNYYAQGTSLYYSLQLTACKSTMILIKISIYELLKEKDG